MNNYFETTYVNSNIIVIKKRRKKINYVNFFLIYKYLNFPPDLNIYTKLNFYASK